MEPSREIGKWLIIGGMAIIIFGVIIYFGSRGLPIGRLPGDIRVEGERYTLYFPIATGIVISIILTILLNLFLSRR